MLDHVLLVPKEGNDRYAFSMSPSSALYFATEVHQLRNSVASNAKRCCAPPRHVSTRRVSFSELLRLLRAKLEHRRPTNKQRTLLARRIGSQFNQRTDLLSLIERIERRKAQGIFFREATFYGCAQVDRLLSEAAFDDLCWVQTLCRPPEDIVEVEALRPGHGEGAFVVVRAAKR